MAFSLYYFFILLVSVVTLGVSIFLVLKTYLKYKVTSHLLMTIAFMLLVTSVLILCIGGLIFGPTDINSDILLLNRQLGNVFIALGYNFVFHGFLRFRTEKVALLSNIVSFLGGLVVMAFFFPNWIELSYDTSLNRINGKFSFVIQLLMIPFILIMTIYWIRPLLRYRSKDYSLSSTIDGRYQLIGFTFLILWVASTFITHIWIIGAIRGLIAYLPWIFWSLSIKSNPLILCHTRTTANWLLVLHKESGIPLFFYSFSENQPKDMNLAGGFFSAIQSGLDEVLSTEANIFSVNFKDKKLLFHHSEDFTVILNTNSTDNILLIALQVFSEKFHEKYNRFLKKNYNDVETFNSTDQIIKGVFSPLFSDNEHDRVSEV